MVNSSYKDWDRVYREYSLEVLPWELGHPRQTLIELVESGRIKPCRVLDVCCGAGTNPIYLAEKGFNVTALDISRHALRRSQRRTRQARVEIQFLLASFVTLPFEDERFEFVFDMGCFHHVKIEDREQFIQGVSRVLKSRRGLYLLVCFSDKNGPAWNHFTKEQLVGYFSQEFRFESVKHFGSVEADGYRRFFYAVLMQKRH